MTSQKLKEGSGHSSKTEQNKKDKRKRTTVTPQLTLAGNHIIQKKKVQSTFSVDALKQHYSSQIYNTFMSLNSTS